MSDKEVNSKDAEVLVEVGDVVQIAKEPKRKTKPDGTLDLPAPKKRKTPFNSENAHLIRKVMCDPRQAEKRNLPAFGASYVKLVDSTGNSELVSVEPVTEIVSVKTEEHIIGVVADYLTSKEFANAFEVDSGEGLLFHTVPHKFTSDVLKTWHQTCPRIPQDRVPKIRLRSETGLCWFRLPFDLDSTISDLETAPRLAEIISRCGSETAQESVLAWIGSLFVEGSDRSQYLYLYGHGGNSKGVLIEFLKALLGPMATTTTAPSTSSFGQDPYWLGGFYKARLVTIPDCKNTAFITSEMFMSLTGNQHMPIQRKYQNVFEGRIDCKFLIAANEKPVISSARSDKRRSIFVNMSAFKGAALGWEEHKPLLMGEAEAFISYCVKVYKKLCPRNTEIPVDQDILDLVASENESHWDDFITNRLVFHPALSVDRTTLRKVLAHERLPSSQRHVFDLLEYITRQAESNTPGFGSWEELPYRPNGTEAKHRAIFGFAINAQGLLGMEAPAPMLHKGRCSAEAWPEVLAMCGRNGQPESKH